MGSASKSEFTPDLTGKTAIVTGGSRGLGRKIVNGLAACGADVLITSRNLDSCQAAADEVRAATGQRALAYACHVGRWDELDGLVDHAYDQFGQVDVLINNAGIAPTYPSLLDVSEKLWDSTLALNLKGPFRLTSLVGTRMAAGEGGSIVNVSSIGSTRPNPYVTPYAASKAGLNALTVSFAHAFGPKVRVNAVLPGAFRTEMLASESGEAAFEERTKRFALARFGEPSEIIGAVVFLASSASSYVTGALLPVDGGPPL